MRFHIVTIFPQMFESYFSESIISRAIKSKKIFLKTYDLRKYTKDKHRRVDGRPYGGGPGMVMWVDPIVNCVEKIKREVESRKSIKSKVNSKILKTDKRKPKTLVVILSPGGESFTNNVAKSVSKIYTDIIFICGRYEGIDSRVKKILKAKEWSVGDYVVTGGELPTMICIDSISRQIKGVLNDSDSIEENRISSHEMYARPEVYERNGKKYRVPKVLLSGNHKLIDEWRGKTEINKSNLN